MTASTFTVTHTPCSDILMKISCARATGWEIKIINTTSYPFQFYSCLLVFSCYYLFTPKKAIQLEKAAFSSFMLIWLWLNISGHLSAIWLHFTMLKVCKMVKLKDSVVIECVPYISIKLMGTEGKQTWRMIWRFWQGLSSLNPKIWLILDFRYKRLK